MPKRDDIRKICIIGAGPIIIGQACEFDYSGTQACKALREEGYEVVLINSNPATIMTDPETAPHTYIEPVTPEALAAVLRKERPDAILPTLGGQTALNTAFKVAETGLLEELGIEMIGATAEVIHRAEDRDAFRETMRAAGIDLPHSGLAHTMDEAREVVKEIGLPCIIRPAFTLGGTGGGMAYNMEEFERVAAGGLHASLINEILVEEDLTGWKEFEVEVMRDRKDNVVIVCSIENFDPMGVHTGDAITVAPIQTMTDREYQKLRDDSVTIIRAIGVETGGCNIQFAQCPRTGRIVVIEMNPRVSRSSALASKATGFPIAKIAAKVAIGYTLDEIPNDITRETPACFEPSIDYCVVKIPRFAFEKFPGSDDTLTIQMKSVGEVMAIGRTFKEALQKGLRSMENGRSGLGSDGKDLPDDELDPDRIREHLARPNRDRLYWIRHAFKAGMTTEAIHDITMIDPWFLDNVLEIVETEEWLAQTLLLRREEMAHDPHNAPGHDIPDWFKQRMTEETARPENRRRPEGTGLWLLTDSEIRLAKSMGFSDVQLAHMAHVPETEIREERIRRGIEAVYKLVDTCGAEFEAATPYYYSTYEEEDETRPGTKEKVMILGGGPNRIGQGIEFDYCCCHASFASKDLGYESIMMNCNPETVSTDYDTSDRLYFDPLTVEDVLSVVRREKPKGLIVQFGGQTPLNIARRLSEAGVPILGTSVDSIDRAEDREQFSAMLDKLGLQQTPNATTIDLDDAIEKAEVIGYPVLMRPSFVLGGAKMEIVYTPAHLRTYWGELIQYCQKADVQISKERPILIDKFLEDATEVDTDALCDGTDVYIAGIMEHIEEAGIHSGDSACSLPPYSLSAGVIRMIEEATVKLALELGVRGLMNVQYAIKDEALYVLEVNPRASRTVPFVSKVTGVSVARLATMVMLGKTIAELGLRERPTLRHVGVKESVFPWSRFPGVDAVLGPEMKSTGEVMGIDTNFPMAFAKSQIGAGTKVPLAGTAFLSVKEADRRWLGTIAKKLHALGFHLVATAGTAQAIRKEEIPVEVLNKVSDRKHPNVIDYMIDGRVHLVINTPSGKTPRKDEILIRTTAVNRNVPLVTTMAAARAFIEAIGTMKEWSKSGATDAFSVRSLQSFHADTAK